MGYLKTAIEVIMACFAVIGFYSRKPAITRYVSFVANGLWLVYAIFVWNISSIVCNIVLLTSAVIGTLLAAVNKQKAANSATDGEEA